MKIAIIHENLFANVYNEQVITQMKKIASMLPDKNRLLQEMESSQAGFIKMISNSTND
jgi:hypothetical protein